jgi:hypothetical protein
MSDEGSKYGWTGVAGSAAIPSAARRPSPRTAQAQASITGRFPARGTTRTSVDALRAADLPFGECLLTVERRRARPGGYRARTLACKRPLSTGGESPGCDASQELTALIAWSN